MADDSRQPTNQENPVEPKSNLPDSVGVSFWDRIRAVFSQQVFEEKIRGLNEAIQNTENARLDLERQKAYYQDRMGELKDFAFDITTKAIDDARSKAKQENEHIREDLKDRIRANEEEAEILADERDEVTRLLLKYGDIEQFQADQEYQNAILRDREARLIAREEEVARREASIQELEQQFEKIINSEEALSSYEMLINNLRDKYNEEFQTRKEVLESREAEIKNGEKEIASKIEEVNSTLSDAQRLRNVYAAKEHISEDTPVESVDRDERINDYLCRLIEELEELQKLESRSKSIMETPQEAKDRKKKILMMKAKFFGAITYYLDSIPEEQWNNVVIGDKTASKFLEDEITEMFPENDTGFISNIKSRIGKSYDSSSMYSVLDYRLSPSISDTVFTYNLANAAIEGYALGGKLQNFRPINPNGYTANYFNNGSTDYHLKRLGYGILYNALRSKPGIKNGLISPRVVVEKNPNNPTKPETQMGNVRKVFDEIEEL